VSGVGESKLRDFGEAFMGVVREWLQSHEKLSFEDEAVSAPPSRANTSVLESLDLFRAGKAVAEIAKERGLAVGTVYGHLSIAADNGEAVDISGLIGAEEEARIGAAFADVGWANIVGVREKLGGEFDYGLLKLYRAVRMPRDREGGPASPSATGSRTAESPSKSPALAPSPV
jgi:ATP-dependent DNA helicase RecQ